ncbi:MAG: right-handed parallel beta-helix repeat-containing protein, partial [Candidatus Cloacimonetes bacterium]|nr:right-handed parallel beta-helix repeat-containing protein [Candidatus Cloacimonadota bacterium]
MEAWWNEQNPEEVYYIATYNWEPELGVVMPYATEVYGYYSAFGNGYVPFFGVIGAGNIYMHGGNDWQNATNAVPDAVASFVISASLTSNIQTGPPALGVQFQSMSYSPDGDIISWLWDFGDGTTSSEENPYHLYETPGTYDVYLQVSDGAEVADVLEMSYVVVSNTSDISGETSGIWRTELSPYNISDDLLIPEGCTVEIEPGVEIISDNGSLFSVYGKLLADASEGEPIIFSTESVWDGIKFSYTTEANIINNCQISGATVNAISVNNSKVDIIGNTFFDNSSMSSTGASIAVNNSDDVLISENVISNNENSNMTGGISCSNSSPEISYNIIVNNSGKYGAFSFISDSNPTVENNTIANNLGTTALMFVFSSDPTIKNSIVIDNGTIFHIILGEPIISYNCISGGYDGTGNIDEDPLFSNPTAGDGADFDGLSADWNLTSASPCIDAGDPNSPLDPDGTIADMGALYYAQDTETIYGDVNGDALITSYDAALTLQYSAGLISDWTEDQITAGDVNGDENISSYDAALILQYSAGLIDEFPVEGGKASTNVD